MSVLFIEFYLRFTNFFLSQELTPSIIFFPDQKFS